eukprot:12929107-Prorocentrum_lima.AAC.1
MKQVWWETDRPGTPSPHTPSGTPFPGTPSPGPAAALGAALEWADDQPVSGQLEQDAPIVKGTIDQWLQMG